MSTSQYKYTRQVWPLYFGTLFFEIIAGIARGGVLFVIIGLIYLFLEAVSLVVGYLEPMYAFLDSNETFIIIFAAILAAYPVITSVLTIVPALFGKRLLPTALYCRQLKPARTPSEREDEIINDIIHSFPEPHQQEIARRRAKLGTRFRILVIINDNAEEISSVGDTIYITTGLLESQYLGPLLARELAHVLSFDSQVELALARFLYYPVEPVFEGTRAAAPSAVRHALQTSSDGGRALFGFGLGSIGTLLVLLAGGGLGVSLFSAGWNGFRQKREFDADRFAQVCGQGDMLIQYVQKYKVYDESKHLFLSPKPFSEKRVERLRADSQNSDEAYIWPAWQRWRGVPVFFGIVAVLTFAVLLAIPTTRNQLYQYTPQGRATAQAVQAERDARTADLAAGRAFLVGTWSIVEQPGVTLTFHENNMAVLKDTRGQETSEYFAYFLKENLLLWPSYKENNKYSVTVTADKNTVVLVHKSDKRLNKTLKRA